MIQLVGAAVKMKCWRFSFVNLAIIPVVVKIVQTIMDNPPLASLSLTHVHYDASDPLSYVSAYLALVPQALVVTYVALIWSTREIEILLMFAGQMGCEGLNWILKRVIQEERPTRTSPSLGLGLFSRTKLLI